jgi:deoxyribodipyrimidine photo-lyase
MNNAGGKAPFIVWFREDLRLADNPALCAAIVEGAPIIPLYVLDTAVGVRPIGGASRWWQDKSLAALAVDLESLGSRLILRRGAVGEEVRRLAAETGSRRVFWNRIPEPAIIERDTDIGRTLMRHGVVAQAFDQALLCPPGAVRTREGGQYKVFSAFWRAVRPRLEQAPGPTPRPGRLEAPSDWPCSEALESFGLHPTKPDWSGGFSIWRPGEAGAAERLDQFLAHGLRGYAERRERPDLNASSRLSPHLRWGEISPRQVWRAVQTAVATGETATRDAETFLSELGWRDFNWQLLAAWPDLAVRNLHPTFDDFPWRDDAERLAAWRTGRTGYPIVDAGMRELWATGFMHNRVRMIAASFLTKHLLVDWREGEAWFWDTLVDADAANNPANWQWVAGSGADAPPFFRMFNPSLQGRKFDPHGHYVRRWIPELADLPGDLAHEPWRAADYPRPVIDHKHARRRALGAYASLKEAQ